MKNLFKLIGIIALAAVIGFSFTACGGDDGDDYGYNSSIDGVWKDTDGWQYSVNSGTATISTMGYMNDLWVNAVDINIVKLGDPYCQNIKSTGRLTWSGQVKTVTYNTSSPNVPTGTNWRDCQFTMSENEQTVTLTGTDSTRPFTETWTRGSVYSLIGVWEPADGGTSQITVYDGSSGYYTRMSSSPLTQSAIQKNYVKNGDQCWRKLVNSSNLIWTGEVLLYSYNTANPNVCTGVSWHPVTLTLTSDGRTLGWYAPDSVTPNDTYIRKK